MTVCPFCAERIETEAVSCPWCRERLVRVDSTKEADRLSRQPHLLAIIAAVMIVLLLFGIFTSNGDGAATGLSGSSCEGYEGKYGCYDRDWCLSNWTNTFSSIAQAVATGDPIGFIPGIQSVIEEDFKGEELSLARGALVRVLSVTRGEGESAGASEGKSQAARLCDDDDFLQAAIDGWVRAGG